MSLITLNATERKALTLSAFAAACVCFAPAQIVSGVVLLIAAFFLHRWDQAALRREGAVGVPPPSPGPVLPAEPERELPPS